MEVDAAPADKTYTIDALPYVDREYTNPNMKKKVDLLVAEEMSRSDKTIEEYLAEISVPEQTSILKNTIFMETEMKRLADKETAPGFDDSRYKVQAPTGPDANSLEAWEQAVNNAMSQLQHQSDRMINLELQKRFSANAWKLHCEQLETIKKRVSLSHQATKKELESINRKRKSEQMGAAPALERLRNQFYETVQSNVELESVCQELENSVKKLKVAATSMGAVEDNSEN